MMNVCISNDECLYFEMMIVRTRRMNAAEVKLLEDGLCDGVKKKTGAADGNSHIKNDDLC